MTCLTGLLRISPEHVFTGPQACSKAATTQFHGIPADMQDRSRLPGHSNSRRFSAPWTCDKGVRLNETTTTDFSIEIQKLCSNFSLDLLTSHFLASSTLHPVMPACSGSGPSYHRASFGQVLMWTSMCVLCTHSHVEGWVPRVVPCPGDELWVI